MYVSMRKTAEKGRFLRLIVANRIVRAASKLLLIKFSTFSHLIKCLLQSRFSGCGLPLSGFDALLFTFPILNLHSIRVFSYGFDLVRQLGAGGGGGAGAGGDGVLVLPGGGGAGAAPRAAAATGAGAAGPAGASAAGAGIGAAGGAVGILRQPCYTRRILNQGRFKHQTHFTPDALYAKNILHHACFTQNTVYARQFLRQHLSHQTPFTPNAFYTKNLSHQAHLTRFTPGAFYIKRILHQRHVTNAY